MNNTPWTHEEELTLRGLIRSHAPLSEIAKLLGRSENSVYLYCYRKRIPFRKQVANPMMRNLLRIKFGTPEFFKPTKEFFKKVKISQKRWSELVWGYVQPTQEELMNVAKECNYTVEETFKLMDSRQLNLFDHE